MKRTHIPRERLRRYEAAAADGSITQQQAIADIASADAAHLFEAGDAMRAGGAIMVMLGATLLRAAAMAGSEGAPADVDLDSKARSADRLNRIGAPVAAAMVRAAVIYERSAMAGLSVPRHPGPRS